jgi:hypothetical protein
MNKLHIFFHNFIACFLIVGVILSSFGFRASSVSAQSYEFSECDDGVDNDGDSFVDYPRDSDCFDFYGSEQAPTPAPAQTVPTRANDISSNTKTYRIVLVKDE